MEISKFYNPDLGIAYEGVVTGRVILSGRTQSEVAIVVTEDSIETLQQLLSDLKGQLRSGKPIDPNTVRYLRLHQRRLSLGMTPLVGPEPDMGSAKDEVRAQGIIEDWIADRLDEEDITVKEQGILTAPVESWKPATFRAREDYRVSETNFATVRLPPDIDGTEKFAALVEELQAHMEGEFEQEPDKDYIDNFDSEYSVEFD